jgi:hypothetical protein
MAQQAFNVLKLLMILPGHKTRSPPGGLHSSRSSDAVHIIFRTVGQIEIDDMADVRHVDSAGGNIGRHQDAKGASLKPFQGRPPLGQTAIPVQHGHPVPCAPQHAPQPIGPMFRPGKDKRCVLIRS